MASTRTAAQIMALVLGQPSDWLGILGYAGALALIKDDLDKWSHSPLLFDDPPSDGSFTNAADLLLAASKAKQIPWDSFCDEVAHRDRCVAERLRIRLGLATGKMFRIILDIDLDALKLKPLEEWSALVSSEINSPVRILAVDGTEIVAATDAELKQALGNTVLWKTVFSSLGYPSPVRKAMVRDSLPPPTPLEASYLLSAWWQSITLRRRGLVYVLPSIAFFLPVK